MKKSKAREFVLQVLLDHINEGYPLEPILGDGEQITLKELKQARKALQRLAGDHPAVKRLTDMIIQRKTEKLCSYQEGKDFADSAFPDNPA